VHTISWKGDAQNERLRRGEFEETQVTMHHNGDYSGNVKFILPNRIADVVKVPAGTWTNKTDEELAELNIPFEAVKILVLNYLRDQQIVAIENPSGLDDWDF
jgi:hypothetical protein